MFRDGHTPGARPDLESCMRTLMVSSGWQHSFTGNSFSTASHELERITHSFHGASHPSCGDMGSEAYMLFIFVARHDALPGCNASTWVQHQVINAQKMGRISRLFP